MVTSQPTPEKQAEMAETLASQMTEQQKTELMAQLSQVDSIQQVAPAPVPTPVVPVQQPI